MTGLFLILGLLAAFCGYFWWMVGFMAVGFIGLVISDMTDPVIFKRKKR